MGKKTFRTLDEQIEILDNKGLIINDKEAAKNILLKENYFFINGYRDIFLNNTKNRYIEGTTLEELHALFVFDRELRSIILKNIFALENHLKSIFSYQLSKKYGYREKDYLKPENFTDDKEKKAQLNDVLKKMQRQVRNNIKQHQATMHYRNNYGYIPLWVLVKVISFGIVSEFYTVLKEKDQIEIAKVFNTDPDNLTNYLTIVSNYRNICAHEDILYENRTQKTIDNTVYHKELKIPKDEDGYIYGKDDLFALVIILKRLLNQTEFDEMIYKINSAITELDMIINTVDIKLVLEKMGFPENWKEIEKL